MLLREPPGNSAIQTKTHAQPFWPDTLASDSISQNTSRVRKG
jgi:hypothetical protein